MDYEGQRLSELLYIYIIVIIGVIAWIYGYLIQSFKATVVGWFGGLVFCMVLCVPDWPMYNRNPVEWLKEIPLVASSAAATAAASDKSDKKAAKEPIAAADAADDAATKKKKTKPKKDAVSS